MKRLHLPEDLSATLDRLADRLGIPEVRSLALLMRQSQELGTSLAATLRVFSEEMRDKRIVIYVWRYPVPSSRSTIFNSNRLYSRRPINR